MLTRKALSTFRRSAGLPDHANSGIHGGGEMKRKAWMMVGAFVLSLGGFAAPAHAATSGSFVFDFVDDAGDNADGPQYDMTFVGLADD